MTRYKPTIDGAPPAVQTGLAAILLAVILSLFRIEWAAVPLFLFVLVCLAAPFFPGAGFFLHVISRGKTGRSIVSLTFDDGPDPVTTGPLLELLDRHAVKAAFFVTGENVARYGHLVSAILDRGHEVGNHSYHHDPFLMLRGSGTVHQEISSLQCLLRRFGIITSAFRPPVGITNPGLRKVLRRMRLFCVTFSCRANDFGNRRIDGLAKKILRKVKSDDIILLHDIRPAGKMGVDAWLREIDLIVAGLKDMGLQAVSLTELIGRPVMVRTASLHRPPIKNIDIWADE